MQMDDSCKLPLGLHLYGQYLTARLRRYLQVTTMQAALTVKAEHDLMSSTNRRYRLPFFFLSLPPGLPWLWPGVASGFAFGPGSASGS